VSSFLKPKSIIMGIDEVNHLLVGTAHFL
jgi:hypothetical protein